MDECARRQIDNRMCHGSGETPLLEARVPKPESPGIVRRGRWRELAHENVFPLRVARDPAVLLGDGPRLVNLLVGRGWLSAHQVDNIDHLAASIHEDFEVPSVPVVDNNHSDPSIRDLPPQWFVYPKSNADNPIPI